MNKKFVIYKNTLGDAPNASTSLTLEKEYEIKGDFNWVTTKDSFLITNDKGQTTHYFRKRFSEPYEK